MPRTAGEDEKPRRTGGRRVDMLLLLSVLFVACRFCFVWQMRGENATTTTTAGSDKLRQLGGQGAGRRVMRSAACVSAPA